MFCDIVYIFPVHGEVYPGILAISSKTTLDVQSAAPVLCCADRMEWSERMQDFAVKNRIMLLVRLRIVTL